MTTTISFTIPGKMAGKGRGRVFQTGKGYLRTYTPENTRNAEAMIRDLASQAMKGLAVFDGPVEMYVNVWRITPPSWPKKRRAAAKFITGKPDADNILKIISDSLNRVVYLDDSQIAVAHIQRRWHPEREEVYVLVRTLDAGSLEHPDRKDPLAPLRIMDTGTGQNGKSPVVERNNGGSDRPATASVEPQNGEQEGAS
jgi:Holliday junction resolvase RusA-like endonuclease